MKRGTDPGLTRWIDELGELLRVYFDDPQHWRVALDRAHIAPCDTLELMHQRSEAGRAILFSAMRMALRMALPTGTSAAVLLGPEAPTMHAALDWWAVGAADHAQKIMFDRWGDRLPPGLPQVQAQRRERVVEQAVATRQRGETTAEILERAGVSRAHGYRILATKPKK